MDDGTSLSDRKLEDLEPIPPDWKEPRNFKEAMNYPRWVKSMKREIKALRENETWRPGMAQWLYVAVTQDPERRFKFSEG